MAAWRTWHRAIASGLVRRLGEILLVLVRWLGNTIFLVRPFAQVDHLAAFAAERAEWVVGVPLVFFAATRTGNDRRFFFHHEDRLQKVSSNGTSCSNSVDFAAKFAAMKRMLIAYLFAPTSGMHGSSLLMRTRSI